MEEWRPIKKAPQFEVSNLGRIRHIKHQRIRKLRTNPKGYLTINFDILGQDCPKKTFSVHRLVAEAFLEDFTPACHIDHINRKRYDNRLVNLRCVTPRENNKNRGVGVKTVEKIIKLYLQGYSPDEILDF